MDKKIAIFALTIAILAFVELARAQPRGKMPRIGYLSAGARTDQEVQLRRQAFLQGMHELGYVEGQNIEIEYRYAHGDVGLFPDLVDDLVDHNVEAIVVSTTRAALATKQVAATMPIIVAASGDPVGTGLVASLEHPGRNVTGLSIFSPELTKNRLELIKEIVPRVSRVAVLAGDPAGPTHPLSWWQLEVAASALGLHLRFLQVRNANEFEKAFKTAIRGRAEAILVMVDPFLAGQRNRIVELEAKSRLPAVYPSRDFAESGGLLAYGPNYAELWRRAASYVNKILKGAKPKDLPMGQPAKFELVINLKTAKQIGLVIPPEVVARADKVIW